MKFDTDAEHLCQIKFHENQSFTFREKRASRTNNRTNEQARSQYLLMEVKMPESQQGYRKKPLIDDITKLAFQPLMITANIKCDSTSPTLLTIN